MRTQGWQADCHRLGAVSSERMAQGDRGGVCGQLSQGQERGLVAGPLAHSAQPTLSPSSQA